MGCQLGVAKEECFDNDVPRVEKRLESSPSLLDEQTNLLERYRDALKEAEEQLAALRANLPKVSFKDRGLPELHHTTEVSVEEAKWYQQLLHEHFVEPCGEASNWVKWFKLWCQMLEEGNLMPLAVPFAQDFEEYTMFLEVLAEMAGLRSVEDEDYGSNFGAIREFRQFWAASMQALSDDGVT